MTRNIRILAAFVFVVLATSGCASNGAKSVTNRAEQSVVASDLAEFPTRTVQETFTSVPSAPSLPASPAGQVPGDLFIRKVKCNMIGWSDIKARDYTVVWQDRERLVLGSNIYQTTLQLQERGKNERYLALYTNKVIDAIQWRGKTYDNYAQWTIGSEGPNPWTDGGVEVFVVPKEMLASEYWKEIKVVWCQGDYSHPLTSSTEGSN